MTVEEFISRLTFYRKRLEEDPYSQAEENISVYASEADYLIDACAKVLKTIPDEKWLKSEVDRVQDCLHQVKSYLPVRGNYQLQSSLIELEDAIRSLRDKRENLQPSFDYLRNSQIDGLYDRTNELLQRVKQDIAERGEECIVEVAKSSKEDLKLEEQVIERYAIVEEDLPNSKFPQLSLIQLVNALIAQLEFLRKVQNENNNS